jgi:hypothetical protein
MVTRWPYFMNRPKQLCIQLVSLGIIFEVVMSLTQSSKQRSSVRKYMLRLDLTCVTALSPHVSAGGQNEF